MNENLFESNETFQTWRTVIMEYRGIKYIRFISTTCTFILNNNKQTNNYTDLVLVVAFQVEMVLGSMSEAG